MAGQKNEPPGKNKAWQRDAPGSAGHSPALAWLSLVGMLPSSAQLRFTKHRQYILCIQPAAAKPAKRAHRLTTIYQNQTTSIHRLVLTRPSVAGSNAPRDSSDSVFFPLPSGNNYVLVFDVDSAEHSVFTYRPQPGESGQHNPKRYSDILTMSTAS
mgnify:CR=1 FL=1